MRRCRHDFWFCRDSHHGCTWRNVFVDHGPGSDHRMISNGDVLQNGHVCADKTHLPIFTPPEIAVMGLTTDPAPIVASWPIVQLRFTMAKFFNLDIDGRNRPRTEHASFRKLAGFVIFHARVD